MCGRFVQTQSAETYAEYFSVETVRTDPISPSWNVAPTDLVYAIAEHDAERQLGSFAWGLIPWWAKDRKIAAKHINARVETVSEKPAFRDSFKEKRCIIPADGSSHVSHAVEGRITGIRSWRGDTTSFGRPVMIVHVRCRSSVSGSFHEAHSPARASGSPAVR